jgi:pimeloyl-ACP methyl ester carboxylesterase
MKQALIYLPGVDGTGQLLHRQQALWDNYAVSCASYPQLETATYEELADAAVEMLEGSAGKLPAVVLTESFGGGVALTLALKRPDLVARLVLINSFAYYPRRPIIHLAAALGRLLPHKPSHPATRGFRGIFFFSPEIPKSERDAWWDRPAGVPMSGYGWRFRRIIELDLRPRLREIDIPAVVLSSDNDLVVPAAAGHALARGLPRAHHIRLKVGHAALIHPSVDVAKWLADERYWSRPSKAEAGMAGR